MDTKPGLSARLYDQRARALKVRMWEKGAGIRGPYEYQRKRWQEDREKPYRLMLFVDRPKPYDRGATGELNIEVLGWAHGRQTSWGDRKRWTLEDRLPQLMRELETQRPSRLRSDGWPRSARRPNGNASGRRRWSAQLSLDPDVTHEALKPYLGKWSPYGPRGW